MSKQREIQRERLFYIEFLAVFSGQVTRKDLVGRFGISEPAATKDLALYVDLAPGMLDYDLRKKCYVYRESTAEPFSNTTCTSHCFRSSENEQSRLITVTRKE